MFKHLLLILLLLGLSIDLFAQIPLNKRDQQRKAEFEAQIAAEEKYAIVKAEADKAFVEKDYVEARMKFQEAIQFSPKDEQWLISKVNDLDILMAKNIAREVDSISVITSNTVRPIEVKKEPTTAIVPREEAMLVLPKTPEATPPPSPPAPENEVIEIVKPEPKASIEVKEESVLKTAPKTQEKVPVVPSKPKPEKNEVRVKDDFAKYPQGMSDETFEFPDHTVRRVVVKDGMDIIVYKYVTHRWGGKFYFKDDVSIVERIWKEEVEAFAQKYPSE